MRQPDHWWLGRPALLCQLLRRTLFLIVSLALWPATATAADRITLQYNRDVRPILAENCFPCHGPDSAARKADLRLDRRDAAIEGRRDRAGRHRSPAS